MIRKLGVFEQALVISDRHAPFNVVSVLQLEHPPAPKIVEHALAILQKRHPLMQAGIKAGGFERLSTQVTSCKAIEQQGDIKWLNSVEQEMNTRLDTTSGLFRAIYFFNDKNATLILTFHHAIMDAVSGMNLLNELLQICVDEVPQFPNLEVAPAVEKHFPPAFQGPSGLARLAQYAFSQMM